MSRGYLWSRRPLVTELFRWLMDRIWKFHFRLITGKVLHVFTWIFVRWFVSRWGWTLLFCKPVWQTTFDPEWAVVVDRFRISVSQKPCVVERNGAYFWTRGTRQTCLGGIFGQEDPWWRNFFSLTHHFLFCSISETVRRRAKWSLFSNSGH